jgi:four helix bundle protein
VLQLQQISLKDIKKMGIKDKLKYMNISQGSFEETRCFLILASDLGYGEIEQLSNIAQEVSKLFESYMSKHRQSL